MLREASPRATSARGGCSRQPGLQTVVPFDTQKPRRPSSAMKGWSGKRARNFQEAALEVGQHAVHVHQHPRRARPAGLPDARAALLACRRAAGRPRAPAAQPDHGPRRRRRGHRGHDGGRRHQSRGRAPGAWVRELTEARGAGARGAGRGRGA